MMSSTSSKKSMLPLERCTSCSTWLGVAGAVRGRRAVRPARGRSRPALDAASTIVGPLAVGGRRIGRPEMQARRLTVGRCRTRLSGGGAAGAAGAPARARGDGRARAPRPLRRPLRRARLRGVCGARARRPLRPAARDRDQDERQRLKRKAHLESDAVPVLAEAVVPDGLSPRWASAAGRSSWLPCRTRIHKGTPGSDGRS